MSTDGGPNLEMRALLAVVLSLAVLIGYQMLFAPPPPPDLDLAPAEVPGGTEDSSVPPDAGPGRDRATTAGGASAPGEGDAGGNDAAAGAPVPGGDPEGLSVLPTAEAGSVGEESERTVVVENDVLRLSFTNRGGRIESMVLPNHESNRGGALEMVVSEFRQAGRLPLELLAPEAPGAVEAANRSLYRLQVDGARQSGGVYRPGGGPVTVSMSWADDAGNRVEKRIVVPAEGYLLDLEVSVRLDGAPRPYVAFGPGLVDGADASTTGVYLVRGALFLSQGELEHWSDGDLEEPQRLAMPLTWGGVESSYFLSLFVTDGAPREVYMDTLPWPEPPGGTAPAAGAGEEGTGEAAAAETPGSGARFGIAVPPGGLSVPVYLGPKDVDILAAHGHDLGQAVDYGMFAFLVYPLLVALKWIYGFVGNYGVAIILLTVLIRILFLPLTHTSFKSMRKMQALQPEMQAIRARYKGVKDLEKKQEMNNEIMGLYKKHGVSPLGGCLPMLLQMPVLFAFYACLSVAIEIRHAPFILWIDDLSRYDPYYVMPILMGVSMYAQQRMTPTTADPAQARIFRMMPVLFTFFFLNLPSGLVLYWFVNNLLGIGQQGWISHQMAAEDGGERDKGQGGKRKKRKKKRGK